MLLQILKEKDTWVLGTMMYVGVLIGLLVGYNMPTIEKTPITILITLILGWLVFILLLTLIKLEDRVLRDD